MESLREINLLSICVRIVLSIVIGGILGMERERKNIPAGFRTYMLVCLGSAMAMMTNQYVFQMHGTSDPTRMGAQVISGIGFLGAGTIMITGRRQIKGVTTAAGLWASACCGLAIGVGFYEGAIIGGITVLVVMTVFGILDDTIRKHASVIEVYMEFGGKRPFSGFLIYARENLFEVTDIQVNKNKYLKDVELCVILTLKSQVKRTHDQMMELISQAEGILYLEEM